MPTSFKCCKSVIAFLQVLIGRRESFQIECNEESASKEHGDASSLHPAPIPSQEIYVVVTQPW